MKFAILFSLLFFAGFSQAAIFGIDDRQAITPAVKEYPLARSTAIAVLSAHLSENPNGTFNIATTSMSPFVCAKEKFAADPSLSYACTGFLVGPDLLATAGHCMVNTGESRNDTSLYCPVFSWLFNFHRKADGQVAVDEIPAENLYRCKEVIYAVREEVPPYRDYALVRLQRPVVNRPVLKLAVAGIQKSDELSLIGYPLGTPAKVSRGGQILLNDSTRQSFVTNLDAFEGNSGSPVLNKSNEVTGILIAGTPSISLIDGPNPTCQIYNRCDEKGENCTRPDTDTSVFPGFQRVGSEVQRIQGLSELIRSLRP